MKKKVKKVNPPQNISRPILFYEWCEDKYFKLRIAYPDGTVEYCDYFHTEFKSSDMSELSYTDFLKEYKQWLKDRKNIFRPILVRWQYLEPRNSSNLENNR